MSNNNNVIKNNVTLECRQSDSNNVRSNGDYSTTLSTPVVLNEGDSILISKSFIDTSSQSDSKINIPNDIKVDLSFYRYFSSVKHGTATAAQENKNYTGNTDGRSQTITTFADGQDYIQNKLVATGSYPAAVRLVTTVRIASENVSQNPQGEIMGSTGDPQTYLAFSYMSEDGKTRRICHILVEPQNIPTAKIAHQNINVGFLANLDFAFIAINGNGKRGAKGTGNWNSRDGQNCNPDKIEVVASSAPTGLNNVLTPIINTLTINIDKGNYTALDMVALLNDKFQNNYLDGEVAKSDIGGIPQNPLLTQSEGLPADAKYWVSVKSLEGTAAGNSKISLAQPTTAGSNSFWFGSSQLNIDFSLDSNKFFIKYAHMPLYASGGAIYGQFQEDNNGNVYYAGKSSGVALQNLEAVNNDPKLPNYGKVYDFWNGDLGIDISTSITSEQIVAYDAAIGTEAYIFSVMNNYGNGISTTTGRPILDAIVDKNSAFPSLIAITDPTALEMTLDLTVEIYATTSVLNPLDLEYGYFLIEVSNGFSSEIIGATDITRNISAIVNRYYSLGAYTSSEDSSLVYTHSGAPLYLNNMNIRILDSDKQPADNLDADNTVFIQIVRG
tara:strand:+ start:406 stop:2241 length:1836 start_codon:yes stop_codon:yes gene_type:complete